MLMGVTFLAHGSEPPNTKPKDGGRATASDEFLLPDRAVFRFGNRQLRHGDGILSTVASQDGKPLATQGYKTIILWDAERLTAKHVLPQHTNPVLTYLRTVGNLAFSADEKLV